MTTDAPPYLLLFGKYYALYVADMYRDKVIADAALRGEPGLILKVGRLFCYYVRITIREWQVARIVKRVNGETRTREPAIGQNGKRRE
jgi:hypothetical protein